MARGRAGSDTRPSSRLRSTPNVLLFKKTSGDIDGRDIEGGGGKGCSEEDLWDGCYERKHSPDDTAVRKNNGGRPTKLLLL